MVPRTRKNEFEENGASLCVESDVTVDDPRGGARVLDPKSEGARDPGAARRNHQAQVVLIIFESFAGFDLNIDKKVIKIYIVCETGIWNNTVP